MDLQCFDVDIDDKIAHVRMNRPEKANSMTLAFWSELPMIANEISAKGQARAIVLSGEGRNFCSGMDLEVFTAEGGLGSGASSTGPRRADQFRATAMHLQNTFTALEQARMPVIAAIQGACIGGGVDMVTACDLRYAAEDAYFSIQEINIGMTADVGTLQRLPKLIPDGVVRDLAYTGRKMSAAEAFERGLVNEVLATADDALDKALEVAREIASKSPLAVTGTKDALNYARDHSIHDGLDRIATWNSAMLDPADMTEAFTAQIEKRDPEFDDLLPFREGV